MIHRTTQNQSSSPPTFSYSPFPLFILSPNPISPTFLCIPDTNSPLPPSFPLLALTLSSSSLSRLSCSSIAFSLLARSSSNSLAADCIAANLFAASSADVVGGLAGLDLAGGERDRERDGDDVLRRRNGGLRFRAGKDLLWVSRRPFVLPLWKPLKWPLS